MDPLFVGDDHPGVLLWNNSNMECSHLTPEGLFKAVEDIKKHYDSGMTAIPDISPFTYFETERYHAGCDSMKARRYRRHFYCVHGWRIA